MPVNTGTMVHEELERLIRLGATSSMSRRSQQMYLDRHASALQGGYPSGRGAPTDWRYISSDEMVTLDPSLDIATLYGAYQNLRGWDFGYAFEPEAKVDAPSRQSLRRVAAAPELVDMDLHAEDAQLAFDAETLLGYAPLLKSKALPGRLRRVLQELDIQILDQISVDAYKEQMVAHYRTHAKMADPTWRLKPLRGMLAEVPKFALRKAVLIKRLLPEAVFYVDQLAVDPFLIVTLVPLPDHLTNHASRNLNSEVSTYVEVWDEPGFEQKEDLP